MTITKTKTDLTGMRLFFQLLHHAREMKDNNPIVRKAVLVGMLYVYNENREDFRIADNMRDYWGNKANGNEV